MCEVQHGETVQREQEWRAELENKFPMLKAWPIQKRSSVPISDNGSGCAPTSAPTHQGLTMPRVNDMIESKYLKQGDVPDPVIVTVGKLGKVNLAKEGDAPEMKWAIRFNEFEKPMILNSTNIKLLEMACGSDDTDDWVGKEVILFNDENVTFGGQVVGGLRIRRQQAAPTRKAVPGKADLSDMDDDIPFN